MDLKLFLIVGVCCMLRASAQDRDKAMQAAASGQLRRLHSRFGRNFVMPPVAPAVSAEEKPLDKEQMNEIINEITEADIEEGDMEPGMADTWHLPFGKQAVKYFNRRRRF